MAPLDTMTRTASHDDDALQAARRRAATAEAIAQAARKRADAIRAQQEATQELADLAIEARGSGSLPVAEIARLAGLTRKAIYDLIAWRTGEKPGRH